MNKIERLNNISKKIGTRHQRKLRKYSDGFNEKFNFFLKCYRTQLLTFCGDDVNVIFDANGVDAREGFRLYDDGYFNKIPIKSKHPNLLRSIIIAKKSWGLFLNMWAEGISESSFTKYEILNEFYIRNINIPESFLNDFNNRIVKLFFTNNHK